MLHIINLPHLPYGIYVALYKDLQNAGYLREQLLAGNSDFEYAFIDASTILSTAHVLAAAFRAINDFMNDRLRSRNVHSEIVFALSPNNNIAEAFRRFGVSEETKNLLAIKVAVSPNLTFDSVQQHLDEEINGSPLIFEDESLQMLSDIAKIKKIYKLNTSSGKGKPKRGVTNGDVDVDDDLRELEASILGTMALRGAT